MLVNDHMQVHKYKYLIFFSKCFIYILFIWNLHCWITSFSSTHELHLGSPALVVVPVKQSELTVP